MAFKKNGLAEGETTRVLNAEKETPELKVVEDAPSVEEDEKSVENVEKR